MDFGSKLLEDLFSNDFHISELEKMKDKCLDELVKLEFGSAIYSQIYSECVYLQFDIDKYKFLNNYISGLVDNLKVNEE